MEDSNYDFITSNEKSTKLKQTTKYNLQTNLSFEDELKTCYTSVINSFSFNQDSSCLCVSIDEGFKIFNTKPFRESIHRPNIVDKNEYIDIIKLNNRTNILSFSVQTKLNTSSLKLSNLNFNTNLKLQHEESLFKKADLLKFDNPCLKNDFDDNKEFFLKDIDKDFIDLENNTNTDKYAYTVKHRFNGNEKKKLATEFNNFSKDKGIKYLFNNSKNTNSELQLKANKVIIWDDNKAKVLIELRLKEEVLNLEINNDLLYIITIEKIYIFNFSSLSIIQKIKTHINPSAAFSINTINKSFLLNNLVTNENNDLESISSYNKRNLIAYPDLTKGYIRVTNINSNSTILINSHNNIITRIKLNITGDLVATASEKGTVVRLFSTKCGTMLQQLRRGTENAIISSIIFSQDSKFLAVSSNKLTTHVFSLRASYTKLIDLKHKINFKLFLSYCCDDDINLQISNVGAFLNIVSQNSDVCKYVSKCLRIKKELKNEINTMESNIENYEETAAFNVLDSLSDKEYSFIMEDYFATIPNNQRSL
jgi:hypothetical protein